MGIPDRDISEVSTKVGEPSALQHGAVDGELEKTLLLNGRSLEVLRSKGCCSSQCSDCCTRADYLKQRISTATRSDLGDNSIFQGKSSELLAGNASNIQDTQVNDSSNDIDKLLGDALQVEEARTVVDEQSRVVGSESVQNNDSVAKLAISLPVEMAGPSIQTSDKSDKVFHVATGQENLTTSPSSVTFSVDTNLRRQPKALEEKKDLLTRTNIEETQSNRFQLSVNDVKKRVAVADAIHDMSQELSAIFIRAKDKVTIVRGFSDPESGVKFEKWMQNNPHHPVLKGARKIEVVDVSPQDFKTLLKAAQARISDLEKQKKAEQVDGNFVPDKSSPKEKVRENVKQDTTTMNDEKLDLLSLELLHTLERECANKIADLRKQVEEAEKKKDEIADEKKLTNLKKDISKEELKREQLLGEIRVREVKKEEGALPPTPPRHVGRQVGA